MASCQSPPFLWERLFTLPEWRENLEKGEDLEALVPKILHKPQAEIQQMMEMLVRAYDTCVSCSTHALKVTFK
ncbi:MAG: hypothetical protein Q8O43_05895 [Dehalococcoidia bacterium]|nr:hypothetical protein [Dehalococcoidia bacterium]